ncbi:MAG: hypothetical protein KC910_11000, partial [Candidatus Eremiobacteraeota bacterium]|nr:hypothetical protein [Candidatus Eremiobacteraeota bacterium]
TLKRDGVEMTAFMDEQNKRMLDLVQWGDIAGHKAPVINTNLNVDELASVVFEKYPQADFIATYYDTAGARKWSLRSRTDFEVNHIAAQFGGGGHPAAAGFKELGKKAPDVKPPRHPGQSHDKLMTEMEKSSDALRRFAAGQVERALGSSFMASLDGHKLPVVNCPFNREELGQAMLEKYPDASMVGVYYTTASGDRHWTLFGRESADVGPVAVKFGGHGDAGSADFVEGRPAAERKLVAEPKQ